MLRNFQIRSLKFFLLMFIFTSAAVNAQVVNQTYEILGITVEGNEIADASTIIANSGLRVGDEIQPSGESVNKAINRLWSLGIFSDVRIEIEKVVGNGAFIVIKVQEHPRLEKVFIEGEDEVDEDDLMEKIDLIRGQTLKPQEVFRIKAAMNEKYKEEGFLNAEISPVTYSFMSADTSDDEITASWVNMDDPSDTYETTYEKDEVMDTRLIDKIKNRVVLVFNIDEGKEVIVREIDFTGNEAFDDGDLRDTFDETNESTWWKFWSSANFKRDKFEEDLDLLRDFYRKHGYRDFRVLDDSLIFYNNNKDLKILVDVYEGPQYKVRNIEFEGNTVFSDELLKQRLDFDKGDVYNFEKFTRNLYMNEAQTDVSSLYQDRGYLTFTVNPQEIVVAEDSVDIIITMQENNRFKIDEVKITGNDKTKEKVIRRELYTVPGDYFSRSALFRSVQQLANLQYFNVEKLYQTGVDPRPVSDSTVNVIYNVEEKSSDYLNASVGYSGSYGFSGAVGVTLTNFSLSNPFQLGGGQVLSFNWQFGVGNYYRTFTLGFTEPWFMDTPTMVGFDVFDTRQRYIYDLRQSGGTVKVGRRLKWPDNYFYIQGMFKFQYNDVVDGRGYYAEGLSRQYTAGGTISRTDIDNPIFPSKGSKFSLNAELSGGPFLPGNVDYLKTEFKAEWYKRLFNTNRLALYTSADLGYINEIVEGTSIQPFEYFYMGGNGLVIATTPLRGYEDRSVGPKSLSSSGSTITVGGKVMSKYTLELRGALALEPMPIYLLAFAEAGNTYLDLASTDFFDLRRSVGLGARILINPIGLIGFDYGYGFDREMVDGEEPSWLFHFQFGRGF